MNEQQTVNPEPEANNKSELKGIAGWLVIPAIGLILAPIKSTAWLFVGLNTIQELAPEVVNDPRLWLLSTIDISMIVATIIVAVFFFKKRRVAVKAIVGLMIATIFAAVIQVFLIASIFENADADAVVHACVFGSIWIPYFLKSKRVKNTFTE